MTGQEKPNPHSPTFIEVSRDIEAIQVPYGTSVSLPQGSQVSLVHELGGMFTLRTEQGFLVRVDGKDADAIGHDIPSQARAPVVGEVREVREATVWEQLSSCYDPEIPVNIVELGLIYSCKVSALADGSHRVDVVMTLTAPGCGMGQVLKDDVEAKVLGIPGVAEAMVDLVFDPPWDPTMMTEAARLELGMM